LAVRMLRNRQDAEEALQDAFVRAFNALPRFEGRSSFGTWFYRIVYNVCSSALERRGTGVHVSLEREADEGRGVVELPSEDLPPDLQLESSEAQKIVYEEVERLPGAYASTFMLFVVQEMSDDEIVEVTGLPLGTIKARLFRARMMLRTAVARRLQLPIPAVASKENAA
ncbi:MAG: sigma-70 family RNA polymerase sigma factor, partial [Bacteroidota bacterium]